MIKTYLKHLILDKFINQCFDGFIDMFHKPINHYTIYDFPVGKRINTININHKRYFFDNGLILSNEIMFNDVVIDISCTNGILELNGYIYKIATKTVSIFLSDIIGYE